jgi:hypothetical protein
MVKKEGMKGRRRHKREKPKTKTTKGHQGEKLTLQSLAL